MDEKPLLIIDTDAGTDDALALVMALRNPNWNLIAVTTIQGNVSVKQASSNVLRILHFYEKTNIPVHQGCETSLVDRDTQYDLDFHAWDGLGGISEDLPLPSCVVQEEPAAIALVRLMKQHPKEITVIALGPLTNLALAHRLDSSFSQNLKALIIMGGNTEGRGNTTPSAEFNFFCDAEAADMTLREFQCPMQIIGWEVCVNHPLPWDWFNKWVSRGTKTSEFIRKLTEREVSLNAELTKYPGYVTCDLIAMTVLMHPQVMTKCSSYHVSVELHGKLTRGSMIVDRRTYSTVKPNADICQQLNVDELQIVLDQMVV